MAELVGPDKRKAWLVMLATYLAGVVIALNQSKVPPVMPTLLAHFHMDAATGGWMMSSFAVAGIVLGLPAAVIFARLGPKRAGLIAIGCTVLGSAAGALAPSAAVLLLARVVEGVGLGLISVIAPAIISLWFAPQDRGRPMGLWASWVPVGGFIIYNLSGPLAAAFGWQGLWWLGALLGLAAFGFYAIIVEAPSAVPKTGGLAPQAMTSALQQVLRSQSTWLLALVFAAFTFGAMGYGTWSPSYLGQSLALAPQAASFTASLTMLALIPSTLVAGWLLDRTRRRYLVLTSALLLWGLLWLLGFRLPSQNAAVVFMIGLGFVTGFIPTTVFTLTPESLPRSELAGWAIGLTSIGQNLGTFLGPPILGATIQGGRWTAGAVPLVGAAAIGLVASLALQNREARRPRRNGEAGSAL